jgi:hypothetical protein
VGKENLGEVSIQCLKKMDTGDPEFFEKREIARNANTARTRIYEPQNNLKNPEAQPMTDHSFKRKGTTAIARQGATTPRRATATTKALTQRRKRAKFRKEKHFGLTATAKAAHAEARSRREKLFGLTAKAKATARAATNFTNRHEGKSPWCKFVRFVAAVAVAVRGALAPWREKLLQLPFLAELCAFASLRESRCCCLSLCHRVSRRCSCLRDKALQEPERRSPSLTLR